MPSRRHHKKSRHGCTRCKARRVKCDGQRPICANCQRRDERCVQALEVISRPLLSDGEEHSEGSTSTLDLNLQDLELLHHYSVVAAFTLTKDPRIQRMWQISVPKEAFSHPFLMHTILAIGALHLANTSFSDNARYRALAVRHQDIGLAAFRPQLSRISPDNCAALCAAATLTVVFSLASFLDGGKKGTALDAIFEICELARGVKMVAEAGLGWLLKGAMEPLMQFPDVETAPPLSFETEQALDAVRKRAIVETQDDSTRAMYLDVLVLLAGNFRALAAKPDHPALVMAWLVVCDREFIDLLRKEEPLPLVILAHFGVLVNIALENWWCRSYGRQVVEYCYHAVSPSWRPLLAWSVKKADLHHLTDEATATSSAVPLSIAGPPIV